MNPATADGVDGLPLLGSAAGPFRFELAVPEGAPLEERDDPFLALDDSGRLSRVLLGRVAAGPGATLRPLAVKVQRSAYRAGKSALANPQIEELWRRERENLLRAGGGEVVSLIDLGEEAFRSRPVTFCKKVRKYFHPFCPRCRGPLVDCRDDALLRDLGLPEYSKSSVRYLHCPACVAAKGARTFYTASPAAAEEAPRGGAQVRRRSELYRDLAGVFQEKLSDDERRRLARAFPCFECAHRAECYPASGSSRAESLLAPLSYHEFHLLPLEALEFHYDEFADLLGGARWEQIRDRLLPPTAPGRAGLLSALEARYTSGPQWLYAGDASGRFSLEVLRLKLALFGQLARGLRRYHAACRQPHLDLGPAKVMVGVAPAGSALPARWNFQARLIGLASPHRSFPGASAGEAPSDLLFPAPDADPTYLSPLVREGSLGGEESMRVSLRSVSAAGAGVVLEGAVSSERVRLDGYRAGDVVRIVPSSAAGALEALTLWGALAEREERAFRFTARLPKAVPSLAPGRPVPDFNALVAFYRTFHVPCDLYGLGMLLLRAVLVNDERDIFAVDDAVQRVLKKLALRFAGKAPPSARQVQTELASLVEQERGVFGAASVFYARDDREGRPVAIPPALWRDLLAFAFRLLTNLPGFSVCADHADYPADRPEAVMDKVLADLSLLEARVDVELFARADRDREISELCAELVAELSAPKPE
jgi:hypothetical protein